MCKPTVNDVYAGEAKADSKDRLHITIHTVHGFALAVLGGEPSVYMDVDMAPYDGAPRSYRVTVKGPKGSSMSRTRATEQDALWEALESLKNPGMVMALKEPPEPTAREWAAVRVVEKLKARGLWVGPTAWHDMSKESQAFTLGLVHAAQHRAPGFGSFNLPFPVY